MKLNLILIIFLNFYGISSQNNCGEVKIGRGNIVGGSEVERSQFPW